MSRDVAVAAGRGFLVILASKLYFIVSSSFLSLGLPRLFDDPAAFGRFRTVSGFSTLANMVLISAAMQTTARLVADPERSPAAVRTAFWISALAGALWTGGVALFAEPLARVLFSDVTFAPWLRISALIALGYSIYGSLVGRLNGARRFVAQAGLDMVFSTAKVALVLGAVALGFGVGGAFWGFVLATGVAMAVSLPLQGGEAAGTGPRRVGEVLRLFLPLLGTQLLINLLLQLDGMAVKGLLTAPLEALSPAGRAQLVGQLALAPDAPTDGAALADLLSGFYGAARNVGLLPYQATFALTLVVFPLLSDPRLRDDTEGAARALRGALRFTALVGGLFVATLSGAGAAVATTLFGAAYAPSGVATAILVVAGALLSVFVLLTTALSAIGRERVALGAMAASSALAAALLAAFLRGSLTDPVETLVRAALATTLASLGGLALAAVALQRAVPRALPLLSAARIVGSAVVAVAAASAAPAAQLGPVAMIFRGVLGAAVYVLMLLIVHELGRDDLGLLRRLARRRSTENK